MRLTRQNSDAEIEAFVSVAERLGGFDERIHTEWLDGFLSALAAGPVVLTMDEWLPRMAGDAFERAFADPEDSRQATRALHARIAVLRDQLDAEFLFDEPDTLRLVPMMLEWDDAMRAQAVADGEVPAGRENELVTGADWADGFFAALAEFDPDWPASPEEDELELFTTLLHQVHALRLAEGSDELQQHISEHFGSEGADRARLIDEACLAVQDLRLWWVDQAPKPATRRSEKVVGRNDACPCGSGKKYKKCHGAA